MNLLRLGLLIAGFAAAAHVASANSAEWNPSRLAPVSIGPQADRLLVGFRATAANGVRHAVRSRLRARTLLVTEAQTSAADAIQAARRAGIAVAGTRQIAPNMHVLLLPKTVYGAAVGGMVARLRADPAVKFADVDARRYPLLTPDDPLFEPTPDAVEPADGQWYLNPPSATPITLEGNSTVDLSATDAVSAWNITTGSSGVVIADVDTGVRFDHPDLLRAGPASLGRGFGGRLLPGYDFVGQDYDPDTGQALGTYLTANDGDGWDPDPSDPGDWISTADTANSLFASDTPEPSSWHGTRVVGVYGAVTNNGVGIAGMSWGPWILPVRALGKGGGYDSDIIAGIQWAAGMPVSGVPDNPYPADIINLSLGGTASSCDSSSAYYQALSGVTALGVLVVISAGNASGPVASPANCSATVPGVAAVAGLRNVGTKVGYSSFGPEVTVSAPAGNCVQTSGDCLRSIDTTTNLGATGPAAEAYTNESNVNLGTSFSAPIVSGIAALMRSVNANLTPSQLVSRLQSSASPFPGGASGVPTCPSLSAGGECVCPNDGSQCGAGMVNALRAVTAALKPIGVIAIPATIGAGSVLDASGSVAGCDTRAASASALSIVSYEWTATPAGLITAGADTAQVTINPGSGGVLQLSITDSAGNVDTETVALTADSASSSAPATAPGTSATACPSALAVNPAAPTVAVSFAPAKVGENAPSTLTITLSNPNDYALTGSSVGTSLPDGLTVPAAALSTAAAPQSSTTCTGAALSLNVTASSISLSAANIPADGSCTISTPVASASAGRYTTSLAVGALTTGPAGANGSAATATLTVSAPSKGGGALEIADLPVLAALVFACRRRASRCSFWR